VTDELLARLCKNIYPEWMRARLATLIRYFSNDTHRLRMLPFVDDKSDDVDTFISQGLGHQSYSLRSCVPQRPREDMVSARKGEDVRAGAVRLAGPPCDLQGQGRAGVAEGGGGAMVDGAGAGDHVLAKEN
jgi:hypothetical protein